jgi:hypothetical protein
MQIIPMNNMYRVQIFPTKQKLSLQSATQKATKCVSLHNLIIIIISRLTEKASMKHWKNAQYIGNKECFVNYSE